MPEVTLTAAQADRALTLCTQIRAYPGMWIARFDWYTLDAFWRGYLVVLHDDAVTDFRSWGLAYLGAPGSNVDPIFQLRRLHGLQTDAAGEASFGRERATEIAALVCDVVEAYVHARRV
ncbi:MAG TPA: hypothetical protein VE781_13645 [Kineosporiaceae bacterium]|nr:hypothetical protein [Kineosporiaceae bacterium]